MNMEAAIVGVLVVVMVVGAVAAATVVDRHLKAQSEAEKQAGERPASRKPAGKGRA